MQPHTGLLIALEGIDGSGKSTLAHNLHASLKDTYNTILTKEPGATPLGKELRAILQQRAVPVCPLAEYLLFAADRAQHFQTLIIPELHHNKIIISDRMADSSLVYQGVARGLDSRMIEQVNRWAMQGYRPDVTIFVDVTVDVACKRWAQRNEELSAFEREHSDFMERVRTGFHALYKARTDVILIDGNQTPETILKTTLNHLAPWMQHYAQQTDTTSTTVDR